MQVSDDYVISDDSQKIDFEVVHRWLSNSYWSPGISMEIVRRAAENSSLVVCVTQRATGKQIGYGRVISDKATFGYLADIYVDLEHRSKGIGKAIVRFALEHPDHQGFRRWTLGTMDAHGVYESCGFGALAFPDRMMEYRPPSPES